VFGDEWREAGIYARILSPWLGMVFMAASLAFIPNMLFRQRKAMFIDMISLSIRSIALIIGIIMNNIYLGLLLFSIGSTGIVGYNLYLYIYLVKDK